MCVHYYKGQPPSSSIDSHAVLSCLVLLSFLIKPPVAAKSDDYTRDPNASHRNKTLNLPIAKNTSHDRRHRTMAIELLNGIVGEKGCDQQSVSNGR